MTAVTREEFEAAVRTLRERLEAESATRVEELKQAHDAAMKDLQMQKELLRAEMREQYRVELEVIVEKHKEEMEKKQMKTKIDLMSKKSFLKLSKYSGKDAEFDDWRFQMLVFMGETNGMAETLIEVEKFKSTPTEKDCENILNKMEHVCDNFDKEWANTQIFQVLCHTLSGNALSLVKNLYDMKKVNGLVAWWRVSHDIRAMTSQKMQGLASKVFAPKRVKRFQEVNSAIEEWEISVKLFEQTEGISVSDQTKLYGVRQIVPEDLEKDIIRSTTLSTDQLAEDHIGEQVAVRKDTKAATGPVKLEVDMVKKYIAAVMSGEDPETETEEDLKCKECATGDEDTNENDLLRQIYSFMKGSQGKGVGKGVKGSPWSPTTGKFDGYCNHCGMWGHMMKQCRKKDQEMTAWRKGNPGKGGGKGEGKEGKGQGGGQFKGGYKGSAT